MTRKTSEKRPVPESSNPRADNGGAEHRQTLSKERCGRIETHNYRRIMSRPCLVCDQVTSTTHDRRGDNIKYPTSRFCGPPPDGSRFSLRIDLHPCHRLRRWLQEENHDQDVSSFKRRTDSVQKYHAECSIVHVSRLSVRGLQPQ